jgi:hypothetical protein
MGTGKVASPDDVLANIDSIRSIDGFVIPSSGEDELAFLQAAIEQADQGPVRVKK